MVVVWYCGSALVLISVVAPLALYVGRSLQRPLIPAASTGIGDRSRAQVTFASSLCLINHSGQLSLAISPG